MTRYERGRRPAGLELAREAAERNGLGEIFACLLAGVAVDDLEARAAAIAELRRERPREPEHAERVEMTYAGWAEALNRLTPAASSD